MVSGAANLRRFSLAVRACRSASVSVVEFGVDAGTDVVAAVEPGKPCHARYVYHDYSANFGGGSGPTTTTDCTVTATETTIHFRCPGLTDDIPSS